MNFYIIGIDYKTSKRNVREVAYRLLSNIAEYLGRIDRGEAQLLVTCNRIEICGVSCSTEDMLESIYLLRRRYRNLFKNAHILYGTKDVFKYGIRLACGLESQLKGELEILDQLKTWSSKESFPAILKDFWNRIIETAEGIRETAGLDKNVLNVADLLFNDLEKRLDFAKSPKIMILGTGKIAALIAEKKPESANLLFVSRRKHKRAKQLASIANGSTLSRDNLEEHLEDVDVVVGATSSAHCVLKAENFSRINSSRKKKLYIYDLAVPADVALDVLKIPYVELKNLDDLKFDFENDNLTKRLELAEVLMQKAVFKKRESNYAKKYKDRYAPEPACA